MTAGIIKTSGGRWSAASGSNRTRSLWLAGLFVLLAVFIVLSVTIGTRDVAWAVAGVLNQQGQDNSP